MGHRAAIRGAIACVAFAGAAGAATAAESQSWRICRAQALEQDKVMYVLQSAPFDAQPSDTFDERMMAQRPFEAPLKAMGATRVRDATVRCSAPAARQAISWNSGQIDYEKGLLEAVGVRVVEKPWVPKLSPTAQPAPLLVGLGELASRATLASGPEKWGLTRSDYSRLHNTALVKKANVAGRRAALEKAAAANDAYAQHLLAIRPDGQEDDLVMMKKAADQGLVRAMVDYLAQAPWPSAPAARTERVADLKRLLWLGSPHANFYAGITLMEPSLEKADQDAGQRAVLWSVNEQYAPAQLALARDGVKRGTEEYRRQGLELARKAAAQGLPSAQAFLLEHATP